MMNNPTKRKMIIAVIFLFMFIFLAAQFSSVMIYFDDYGYYSLSYGVEDYTDSNDYSIGELISYLKGHYIHSNGRLLGFFIWLSLYAIGGLKLVQLSAAAFTTAVLVLLWKICVQEKRSVLSALLICAFYGLFSINFMNHGTYWFAAFFHYVAPLTALLGFLLLYFKWRGEKKQPVKQLCLCVLIVFSAFSQEQLGAVTAFLMLLLIVYELYRKSFKAVNIVYFMIAVACALFMMYSPGILDRASGNSAGLLINVVSSTYKVIRTFYAADSAAFVILLHLALLSVSTVLQKRDSHPLFKLMDLVAQLLSVATIAIYCIPALRNIFAGLTLERYYVLCVLGIPVIALMALQFIRYYFVTEQHRMLILFCTAVGSVGCLCVLPEVHSRLFVPAWLLLFPVLLDGIFISAELLKTRSVKAETIWLTVVSVIIIIASVTNASTIYRGYAANAAIHEYNHEQMLNAAQDTDTDAVFLKTLPEPVYTCVMPYDDGVQYMKYWIDHYYGTSPYTNWYFGDGSTTDVTQYSELGNHIFIQK